MIKNQKLKTHSESAKTIQKSTIRVQSGMLTESSQVLVELLKVEQCSAFKTVN